MNDFISIYKGRMSGVLRWSQLERIWQAVIDSAKTGEQAWYLYETGAPVPSEALSAEALEKALKQVDTFLHKEHDADYCGVVYADNLGSPSVLKIYHPRKMGTSCGSGGSTVLPKWTLSTMPPIDLIEWSLVKENKPAWWKQMLKKRA